MTKRAVILAGGRGTRLRPYTVVLPKPLMPIGDFPILEVVIRQLAHYRFEHVTLAVNHQAEIIKAYFNSGRKWGLHIDYSLEKEPLGTMGPLKLMQDLPEHFLVMNGDVLTDLNFERFRQRHLDAGRTFTIASCLRSHTCEYGILHRNGDDSLAGMEEKPVITQEVSMGIYMVSRRVLELIPEHRLYGFDLLMADMLAADIPVHLDRHQGDWLDIGRPDDYRQAIEMFATHNRKFLKEDHAPDPSVRPMLRSPGNSRGAASAAQQVAHTG